jgi:hypothetical protein
VEKSGKGLIKWRKKEDRKKIKNTYIFLKRFTKILGIYEKKFKKNFKKHFVEMAQVH